MKHRIKSLVEKLEQHHSLEISEYQELIEAYDSETAAFLAQKADQLRKQIYGKTVFIRGLIEVSNVCKNDCYYCGIRRSNAHCERYVLSKEQILECCSEGYELGFRSFVLQGGEAAYYDDDTLCQIVSEMRAAYPDCAITLSLGEKSEELYRRLYEAGANRYLLRHETADELHYNKLHPDNMSWKHRMECLQLLKEIGYQIGCGFMVGSPYQTTRQLAMDLKFIETFAPDMCGIGPFIPHRDTPFRDEPAGDAGLTCYLLSIIRLACPHVLLPATTALGTIRDDGRERGILSGANVVMPNLSPLSERKKYELYNDKVSVGLESAQCVEDVRARLAAIGYEVVTDRGDVRK